MRVVERSETEPNKRTQRTERSIKNKEKTVQKKKSEYNNYREE